MQPTHTLPLIPKNVLFQSCINVQESSRLTTIIHYYLYYLTILFCLSLCDNNMRLSAVSVHFLLWIAVSVVIISDYLSLYAGYVGGKQLLSLFHRNPIEINHSRGTKLKNSHSHLNPIYLMRSWNLSMMW